MHILKNKTNTLALLFVALFFFPVFSPVSVSAKNPYKNLTPSSDNTDFLLTDSIVPLQIFPPTFKLAQANNSISDLLSYAFQFKGKPYRRGSKGPSSFDCSGFTSYVFKKVEYPLNSSSSSQFQQGESINKNEIQKGDLVFFKGRNSGSTRVGHVGLVSEVLPNGTFKFIHASSSKGICEELSTEGYYSKRFIGARRVISPDGQKIQDPKS